MKTTVLLLTAVVLLAGCTTVPGQTSEEPDRGLVIETASLTTDTIREGERTDLVFRMINTNPESAANVKAQLSNIREGADPTLVEGGTGNDCTFPEIPGKTLFRTPQRLCVWGLAAKQTDASDSRTYPLGITLTYNTRLQMQDASLSFFFTEEVIPGEERQTTTSVSNTELKLTARYPSQVLETAEEIPITLSVTNTGPGTLQATAGTRQVSFDPSGSLVDGGPFELRQCDTLLFTGKKQTASRKCVLERVAAPQPDTSYTLRITARYGYQKHVELPLTILPTPS